MSGFSQYSDSVLQVALVLPRLAAAFLVLPLITKDSAPTLVRNIFLVSLALAIYPLVSNQLTQHSVEGIRYAPLVLKEIFVGVCIGYAFSILFWALEGAGQVIDNKVGSTTAQIVDPISGHQTSLVGSFMSRLAMYLFVAFGGLLVFLDVIISSYGIWPIGLMLPDLKSAGQWFFVDRFTDLMRLILLFSAPALVLLTIIELGFGFINRYAQQLNVFALSMPVKGWLSILILGLMLGTVIEYVTTWIRNQAGLTEALRHVLGS